MVGHVAVRDYPSAIVFSFHLTEHDLTKWVKQLSMLRTGAVDILVYQRNDLQLSLQNSAPRFPPAEGEWNGSCFNIGISALELKRWEAFFESALRDEGADVDHIDVDVVPRRSGDRETTLVFKVSRTGAPVGPDEARARLGLR